MSEARSRIPIPLVPFFPILLVGAVHLSAILAGADSLASLTKGLLMPALVIALVWAAPRRRSAAVVLGVLALMLSWAGDVTLRWFVIGLGFFLLAHLAYLVLFFSRLALHRMRWFAVAYAVWLAVLLGILGTNPGSLLVPVVLYGFVLCAMAAVATRCNLWVTVGGALFVVSDSLLSVKIFLADVTIPNDSFFIMLSYIAAQTLITMGIVRHEQARVTKPVPQLIDAA